MKECRKLSHEKFTKYTQIENMIFIAVFHFQYVNINILLTGLNKAVTKILSIWFYGQKKGPEA